MADLAVCARSAKFNLAYTAAGLTPDAGTSFLLPRIIGARRAMELLLLNRTLSAEEALSWGLVNEVWQMRSCRHAPWHWPSSSPAEQVAPMGPPSVSSPLSLGAFESQMIRESETIAAHAMGAEGVEGIAAFLAKRKPQFPGKEPR